MIAAVSAPAGKNRGTTGATRRAGAAERPVVRRREEFIRDGGQGEILEADIDALFEECDDLLGPIGPSLLDPDGQLDTSLAELQQADEPLPLDDRLERSGADGGPLNADPVWQYLKDIHDIPLLSAEQEVALAKRIEQGDTEALQQFV